MCPNLSKQNISADWEWTAGDIADPEGSLDAMCNQFIYCTEVRHESGEKMLGRIKVEFLTFLSVPRPVTCSVHRDSS
jgi:hypothetical protein